MGVSNLIYSWYETLFCVLCAGEVQFRNYKLIKVHECRGGLKWHPSYYSILLTESPEAVILHHLQKI